MKLRAPFRNSTNAINPLRNTPVITRHDPLWWPRARILSNHARVRGVLSARQIAQVIQYLRSFCREQDGARRTQCTSGADDRKGVPRKRSRVHLDRNSTGTRASPMRSTTSRRSASEISSRLRYVRLGGQPAWFDQRLGDIGSATSTWFLAIECQTGHAAYEPRRILSVEGEIVLATGIRRAIGAGEPSLNLSPPTTIAPHQVFVETPSRMDIPRTPSTGRHCLFSTTLGTSVGKGRSG